MVKGAFLAAVLLAALPAFATSPGDDASRSITDPDIGGFADELHGAVRYGVNGTHVTIYGMHWYTLATITGSGGTTATVSPADAVPEIAGLPGGAFILDIPGGGPGGRAAHGTLTSADPATGRIACDGCTFLDGSASHVVAQFYPNDLENNVIGGETTSGMTYEPVTTATLTDSQGHAYGTELALTNIRFAHGHGSQIGQQLRVCIGAGSSPRPVWCGTGINAPKDDGRSINLIGPESTPTFASANGGAELRDRIAWVYFGPFLFRPDDAHACKGAPRYLDIPFANATINFNTGLASDGVATVALVYSPFQAEVTKPLTAVPMPPVARMREGCDDWPAVRHAAELFYHASRTGGTPTFEKTPAELTFPSDSLMASVTLSTDLTPALSMIFSGEGNVYWPENGFTFYHSAGPRGHSRPVMTQPGASETSPDSFKHLNTLRPGSPATLVTFGNSPFGPNSNGANTSITRLSLLCDWFKRGWPLRIFQETQSAGWAKAAGAWRGSWARP
jgi:hypothetical protein